MQRCRKLRPGGIRRACQDDQEGATLAERQHTSGSQIAWRSQSMTQDEGTRAHVLPQSLSGSSYFGHRTWARQQARFRLQWKLRAGGGGSSCVRPRFRNAMRRRWQLSRPFPDSSLGKHVAQLSRECRWQVLLAGSAAWLDVPTLCSRVELCTSAPAQALALVAARSGLAAAPPLQVRSPHLQLCLGALLVMYRSC